MHMILSNQLFPQLQKDSFNSDQVFINRLYSNENTNGQGEDLRLEEQIKKGKQIQTALMSSLKAFRLIDFVDLLKIRHGIFNENVDKNQNFDSFTTALISAFKLSNENSSFPKPSNEFLNFHQIAGTTVNDILLSRKIGQLGESGYNSTFRPVFITKQQETDFNSKLQQWSNCFKTLVPEPVSKTQTMLE